MSKRKRDTPVVAEALVTFEDLVLKVRTGIGQVMKATTFVPKRPLSLASVFAALSDELMEQFYDFHNTGGVEDERESARTPIAFVCYQEGCDAEVVNVPSDSMTLAFWQVVMKLNGSVFMHDCPFWLALYKAIDGVERGVDGNELDGKRACLLYKGGDPALSQAHKEFVGRFITWSDFTHLFGQDGDDTLSTLFSSIAEVNGIDLTKLDTEKFEENMNVAVHVFRDENEETTHAASLPAGSISVALALALQGLNGCAAFTRIIDDNVHFNCGKDSTDCSQHEGSAVVSWSKLLMSLSEVFESILMNYPQFDVANCVDQSKHHVICLIE
jgi:hypothetical protein